MNLIFLIILISFFIFLYFLYYLCRDDFVIVRKDIKMEKIFNMAFLTAFVSLFSARFFYVLFNPLPQFLNPLGFLAFPYFPGLSLIGTIIGASVFIYIYASFKKMPIGKMFDLFTLSFIEVLPIGLLGTFILVLGKTTLLFNVIFVMSIFIFLGFMKIIYPFSSKGEIKDGSLSLIFLLFFSFLYFITKLFIDIKNFSFLNLENIALLIVLFSSTILLLNQEIVDKFLIKK